MKGCGMKWLTWIATSIEVDKNARKGQEEGHKKGRNDGRNLFRVNSINV
jgi:hypothetical protein